LQFNAVHCHPDADHRLGSYLERRKIDEEAMTTITKATIKQILPEPVSRQSECHLIVNQYFERNRFR